MIIFATDRSRQRFIMLLMIILTIPIVIYVITMSRMIPLGFDAWSYIAAARALMSGSDPYAQSLRDLVPEGTLLTSRFYLQNTPYIYPPFLAFLCMPIVSMNMQMAMYIWILIIGIINVLLVFSLKQLMEWKIAWFSVFFFLPIWESWYNGQVNALIALLFIISINSISNHRVFTSIFSLFLGTMIKITPLAGLLVLMFYHPRRTLMTSLGIASVVVIITLPRISLDTWLKGFLVPFQIERQTATLVSLGSLIKGLSGSSLIAMGLAGGLIAITLYRARHLAPATALAAILLVPLFTAPIGWSHHLVMALPALAVLWSSGGLNRWLAGATWLLLTLSATQPLALVLLPVCWGTLCFGQAQIPAASRTQMSYDQAGIEAKTKVVKT
ncbi:glycosyltransferase family 87 protein [Candidatus Chloroploca sp. Khr17]|uniref:glycosyltransferase family 87 protein n=1 Tax=Candidatus Chloroploca sp. Khr17 TaxID=2496869 RepID=UPI0013ED6190|nr:glycosyltransferase family 87 protein [Candidatus Chloroploca sp. Khr17]